MNTVLIADDEPQLAADIAQRLRRCWSEVEIVAIVENGPQAVEAIRRLKPRFAFLDIRMPGLSGLEVAATATATRIVFVTAYDEYAVAAFDASAADYLLKPVSDERLAQCVIKLQQSSVQNADLIALLRKLEQPVPSYLSWLHTGLGNTTRVLPVEEVLYFQAGDKYTEVITSSERHLIRTSIRELKERLNPAHFCQIHRGTIVNLRAIDKLERDIMGRVRIHLRDHSTAIPVGRAYLSQFKKM